MAKHDLKARLARLGALRPKLRAAQQPTAAGTRYWARAGALGAAFIAVALAAWAAIADAGADAERARHVAAALIAAEALDVATARVAGLAAAGAATEQASAIEAAGRAAERAAEALEAATARVAEVAAAAPADDMLRGLWRGDVAGQAEAAGGFGDALERMARQGRGLAAKPDLRVWADEIAGLRSSPAMRAARGYVAETTDRYAERAGLIFALAAVALSLIAAASYPVIIRPLAAALEDNEARLRRERDRALESARAKREFLAVVSHELRTPLNGVLGVASVLLGKNLQPADKELVAVLKDSGEDLLRILNDILEVARLEAGDYTPTSKAFSLRALLDDLTRLLAPRAAKKGLSFVCAADDTAPDALIGDVAALRKVLLNLIDNAVKFTELGGVVVRVAPAPGGEPTRLRFTVKDTGVGMSQSDIGRIFDRFTQLSAYENRRHDGLGVGLAIARDLTAALGGALEATSEVGAGSEFAFDLAFKPAPSHALKTARRVGEVIAPTVGPRRALVASDKARSRAAISAALAAEGWDVVSATSARDAIAASRADPFDFALLVILFDDDAEAHRLTRAWRAREASSGRTTRHEGARILGVAAAGASPAEALPAWRAAGAQAVVGRPVDRSALLSACARMMRDAPPRTAPGPRWSEASRPVEPRAAAPKEPARPA